MFIQQLLVAAAIISLLISQTPTTEVASNPISEAPNSEISQLHAAKSVNYKTLASVRAIARKAAVAQDDYFAQQLSKTGITLRPGTDYRKDSHPTINSTRTCRSIVYQTLTKLPQEHIRNLRELTLYYTTDGRRGLGGDGVIILRCLNVDNYELAAVFTHEVGHVVDASYLTGFVKTGHSGFFDFGKEVAVDDPSLAFYRLSWNSATARKKSAVETDFVSLYAMSDPFEDFAETYMFYRIHGSSFRVLAQANSSMKAKYEFMKYRVFGGVEYGNDSVVDYRDTAHRQYDATVIPFNLKTFFTTYTNANY